MESQGPAHRGLGHMAEARLTGGDKQRDRERERGRAGGERMRKGRDTEEHAQMWR